jgi:hypothetical protein
MTPQILALKIQDARPGERVLYFSGHLLAKYGPDDDPNTQPILVRTAREACRRGLVHLMQKRIAPNLFRYYAIKKRPAVYPEAI